MAVPCVKSLDFSVVSHLKQSELFFVFAVLPKAA